MKGIRKIWGALAVALMTAGAAQAGQCGYEYCWGAVGTSANGHWGWATGQWSEQDAVNRVQAECGGNCDAIRTFYNTCGAMARASNGGWGFGWAPTRGQAETLSLQYCRNEGPNCRVLVWACSY